MIEGDTFVSREIANFLAHHFDIQGEILADVQRAHFLFLGALNLH